MSIIATRSPLNISETVKEKEAWFQRTTDGKWPMGNRTEPMTSRDPERSSRDPNTPRAHYLKNIRRCYLTTIPVRSAILATAWLLVASLLYLFWEYVTVNLARTISAHDEPTGESKMVRNVFTARCTLVQSAVLRSHVVCLSVCDVGELWSHRLEFFENNFTIK